LKAAIKMRQTEAEKRRAWAAALCEAHAYIAWMHHIKIKTPIIEISDSKTCWGQWLPGIRTIRISAHLIADCSWDIVVHVLKHEMAHQIATDIMGGASGHGREFKRCCEMIGVPEAFCRASGDISRPIPELKDMDIPPEKKRAMEKIDKLLSLGQSANEHEAKLAMKKARQFIEKYNIDRIKQAARSEYVYKIINHKKKRIENYQRGVCSILIDFFFVNIIYSDLYDAKTEGTHKTIELFGTIENVLTAEYVYFFLLNQLASLWAMRQAKTGASFKEKRSFYLGIIAGFREKLDEMEKKKSGPGTGLNKTDKTGKEGKTDDAAVTALVRAEDKMISSFIHKRHPRLRQVSRKSPRIYIDTYDSGIKEGRNLNLRKGVTQKDGYRGKRLAEKT